MSDLVAAHDAQIKTLNENVTAMRATLEKIGDAIVKLAVLEERHANTRRELQATRDTVDELRSRVQLIEENNVRVATTISTLARTWKFLWAFVAGGGLTAIVGLVVVWKTATGAV